MIFGDKFYSMLGKLSPWRQSLFALVLAQRQYANYTLWCDVTEHKDGKAAFNNALKQLWDFHQDKYNNIDLEEVVASFEPFVLDEEKDDLNLGDLFALDATLSLTAACDAILMHEGDEAEMASKASMGGVLRRVEQDTEEDLTDEEFRELDCVDAEVNFQVDLMMKLSEGKRCPELTVELIKLALKDGESNIGIPLEGCCYQDYATKHSDK